MLSFPLEGRRQSPLAQGAPCKIADTEAQLYVASLEPKSFKTFHVY